MKTKVLGIIRILLGAGMLFFWVMKLMQMGDPGTVEMVGGAGHAMGLKFLSVTVWFWIATIGEILAGAMLLTGHKYKVGAILTIIIMAFAINAVGMDPKAIAFLVGAILVLVMGPGCWMLCPCKSCKACCSGMCASKGKGDQQQQQ